MSNDFIILLTLLFWCCVARAEIKSYAALGDSYPAGDGAGLPYHLPSPNALCGRFSEAYPFQIADALGLSNTWFHHPFHNEACGGATTDSVMLKQLYHVRHADLITIQVGGNQVDFFPVLNECIQQWHPLSSCDHELEKARSQIQSPHFARAFDRMVKLASHVKHEDAALLVLGYARFFNAETDQCNGISFSKTNEANVLSNELRRAVNGLVVMMNDVIRASAEAHGAVYVDVDRVFEGHRFCEKGVIEPKPDWEGTWFFREAEKAENHALEIQGHDKAWSQGAQTLGKSGLLSHFADLTRTFHPTIPGHAAIAKEIVSISQNSNTIAGSKKLTLDKSSLTGLTKGL